MNCYLFIYLIFFLFSAIFYFTCFAESLCKNWRRKKKVNELKRVFVRFSSPSMFICLHCIFLFFSVRRIFSKNSILKKKKMKRSWNQVNDWNGGACPDNEVDWVGDNEMEANVQITSYIELEIMKCSEAKKALATMEFELSKTLFMSQFQMIGLQFDTSNFHCQYAKW